MKQLLLIVMMTLMTAGAALAQSAESSSAAKLPLARRLYDEGMDAANNGSWSLAYDRFKASYELAPRVMTLFNLAGAQAQTGRLVEATESYRRYLRETADGRYPELRSYASNQLESIGKQIAQVTLDVPSIEPHDTIVIDEIEFPHAALHQPIPMNPGTHVARILRGASVLATHTVTLASGATESIQLDLPAKQLDLGIHEPVSPPPVNPPVVTSPYVTSAAIASNADRHDSNHAWLRSPWLWSIAAVVVAGSATGAYLLTRPDGAAVH